MGYIGKKPATQGKDAGPSLKLDDISSNFDGNTTVFDLTVGGTTVDPHINNIQIYLSGVHQLPGTSYSLSGSQVVFTGAPSSSLNFHGSLIGDSRIMTPDNNTVEPASFTSNTTDVVSGSWQGVIGSGSLGMVSGSAISTGSFGAVNIGGMSVSNLVDFSSSIASRVTDEESDFTAAGISGSWQGVIGSGSLGMVSGSAISTGSFGRVIVAEMGNSDLTDVSASISTRVNLLEGSGSITESSSSFSTRVSDLVTDSGSFSTRVKLLEGSGSIFESSASFSTRVNLLEGSGSINDLVTASGSFSTRVSDLVTDSGSFSTRVTTAEASGALFDGDGVVTFAGATITGTLTAQEVHTEFISASVTVSTGSNIFGDETGDVHQFTGSIETSGSIILDTLGGNVSGSIVSTGSFGAANVAGMTVSNLVDVSSSLSSRLTDVKTESGSFAAVSSSYSSASGSFSTRVTDLVTDSGSFSTRVSDLVTDSGSFSTRVSDSNLYLSGSGTIISGSSVSTGSFGSGHFTGTGGVGIGTAAPLAKLQVNGVTGTNPVVIIKGAVQDTVSEFIRVGRSDSTVRYHSIKTVNSATAASNFLSFEVHDTSGTETTTEVLKLKGDGHALFSGRLGVGSGISTPGTTIGGDHDGAGDGNGILHLSGSVPRIIMEDSTDSPSFAIEAQDMFRVIQLSETSTVEAEAFRIVSGSGNFGIGTDDPSHRLHVIAADGTSDNTQVMTIENNEATDGRSYGLKIKAGSNASDAPLFIQDHDAANDFMIVRGNGAVGIGTTAPTAKLHVHDTTETGLKLTSTDSDFRIYADEGKDALAIVNTGDAVRFSLSGSGKFGFGKIPAGGHPNYAFYFSGSGMTANGSTGGALVETEHYGQPVMEVKGTSAQSNDAFGLRVQASNGTAWIQQLLDSAGNERFRFTGAGIFHTGGVFAAGNNAKAIDATAIESSRDSTSARTHMAFYNEDASNKGTITTSGDSTAFNTSSDYRWKENEITISDGLTRLNQLKPYRFNFKRFPDETLDGFFAHEVQSIVPHAVQGVKDEVDDDGKEIIQTLDHSKLVPLLVASVQELSEKVEEQAKRIKDLEN